MSDASFFANDGHDIMFYMFADRFMQIEIKGLGGSNETKFPKLNLQPSVCNLLFAQSCQASILDC